MAVWNPVDVTDVETTQPESLNTAFSQLLQEFAASAEPSTPYAYQRWIDTDGTDRPEHIRVDGAWKRLRYLDDCRVVIGGDGTDEITIGGPSGSYAGQSVLYRLPADLGSNGQALVRASASTGDIVELEWAAVAGGVAVLNDLTDVNAGSPSDGQALVWDSGTSKWIPGAGGGGSSTLDGLTDTDIGTPTTGDLLRWNGTDWAESTTLPSHTHTAGDLTLGLSDLTAVDVTGASNGQFLKLVGGTWQDASIVEADISDLGSYSVTGHTHNVDTGGTGRPTLSAYAILAGGTTDTGAVQSISGLGTSGQVLTSNGAAALPTWEDAAVGGATLAALTDTTITSGDSGDFLRHNGSAWVDAVIVAGDIPDISATYSTVGHTHNVNSGGTGRTSLDTYRLLAGGTGATFAMQSVEAGSSGEVLVSGGAGALPTFESLAGAGIAADDHNHSGVYAPVAHAHDVDEGGTGRTSLTAYAVLTGGTTSGGDVQSVAGVGTAGQVLTSNGAGALPTFEDATGGSASDSFKTWVPTTGANAIADSAADTMTILSTDGSITVAGSDDAESLDFEVHASNVSTGILPVARGGTGAGSLAAAGISESGHTHTESDISDLGNYLPVGGGTVTGTVTFDQAELRLADSGGEYVSILPSTDVTGNYTMRLPGATAGSSGKVLYVTASTAGQDTFGYRDLDDHTHDAAADLTGIVPLANGGTGATSLSGAGISEVGHTHDVDEGGTGRTSLTAYALLAGGTTSTGAVQSLAGLGTSGQVLTSNGAGALPTFEDAAGGGSVAEGDIVPDGSEYLRLTTAQTVSGAKTFTTDVAFDGGAYLHFLDADDSHAIDFGIASDAVVATSYAIELPVAVPSDGTAHALFGNLSGSTVTTSWVDIAYFSQIDVDGEGANYVMADGYNDILNLDSGAGMSLTKTTGTDTIEFAVDSTVLRTTGNFTMAGQLTLDQDLDAGSNRLTKIADGTATDDATSLSQVKALVAATGPKLILQGQTGKFAFKSPPIAMTITALVGRCTGGTSCNVNAYVGGSKVSTADLTANAGSTATDTTLQVTSVSADSTIELEIVSLSGAVDQALVQLDWKPT